MATVDQIRKKRIDRIRPFLKELSAEKEPKTNKAVLLNLIQDLKDEGNQLFKEGQFAKACSHYKCALFVARVLEERFYHEVEHDYLATLYSNGSLGYLKTNNFAEALDWSDNALRMQPDNVKAKYRRVQALYGLKRYREALEEAQKGMKKQPTIFKEYVTKLEEVLQTNSPKSATASATAQVPPSHKPDASNEWLVGTNALKTEKQRQAVLEKMPKKKKAKNPQPVVNQARDSSDSDVDSDSSNFSEDERFVSNYANIRHTPNRQPLLKKSNVVRVTPSDPDVNADVLQQNLGFKKVGASGNKGRPNGMGLDDFGMGGGQQDARPRGQPRSARGPKLPPVDIYWPLEEYQFRRACKMCFVKTGEGYKGYNLNPNLAHTCDKDVLVIRRKDNQTLNWIKIRPFPDLFNNRFSDFKMCQQFTSSLPCKIGEQRCTFPHNKNEMNLWYMELDGEFSYPHFMDELRKNGIDTSEQLEARRAPEKAEPQHIPGLNFKTGSRQRLSSPAPLAQSAPRPAPAANKPPPQPSPVAPRTSMPPLRSPLGPSAAFMSFGALPPGAGMPPPRPLGKAGILGNQPHQTISPPRPAMSKPAPSQPVGRLSSSSPPQPMGNIDNSLKDYDYKVVCPQCFIFENFPGKYRYVPCTHICEENVLAVKQRNVPTARWVRVRERTNHRDFPGKYILCNSVLHNNRDMCRYGESTCSFAHNEAEQRIWGMEKAGKFSITDFILQNRHASSSRGFTINELLKKYNGFFTFVCRDCFYGRPPRISEEGPNNCCTGTVAQHRWDKSSVLAHVNTSTGELTLVDHRKFTHKGAFFRICKFLHFCRDQILGKCLSAHSLLERDVWMLERDTDISREEIVRLSQRRPQPSPEQQQQQPPRQQQGWGPAKQTRPAPAPAPTSAPQSHLAPPTLDADSMWPSREKVPYTVQEYCGMCWTNGTKSLQDGTSNRCAKGHGNFSVKRVFLIVGIFRELRSLPSVIPRNFNFVVCRFVQQKKKCQFMGPGPCQFAHSEEERVLWIWMARNKVHKVEDVVKACRADAKKTSINQGDSVVAATALRVTTPVRVPTNLQNSSHYCRYCSIQCNSDRQWEEHCASEKHTFNVNSDKDHQWNYRQPPWGQGSNLDMCSRHRDGERCNYSRVPDMFNLCKYAHSQEELDEWRERYEWRQMKRTLAREQNMFSYMDNLLEQYNSADSPITEMSETVNGVLVTCKQPLEQFRQEKNAVIVWSFVIQTQLTLEKVALLHHSARLHFCLLCVDGSKHQIASGEQFEDVDDNGCPCYRVNVQFSGGMFGSFNQWVAFDFGTKPVLLRKLNVELGHETVHEKVRDLRQKLAFDRWTKENRQVIPYQYTYEDFQLDLIQRYKEPSSEVVVTQDSIRELNRHNYVHKMHRMLELEEITQTKLISSFNLVNVAEVKEEMATEQLGTIRARAGELFLQLPLTENLTEDTGAGKLILTSVRSVLLTRKDYADKHRVYEAKIEGKGKDYVFLALTPVCVRELKLCPGMSVEVEVQFQMNRMHFINMHYALDQLTDTDIVFPDVTKINPVLNQRHTLKVASRALNQDQLQAVRHIVADRMGYTPPFIMFGPFGTGKTETLAQAVMVLLREKPDARILICARSNSGADLYVTKHLDAYLRKSSNSQSLLLRILSKDRHVYTVPESVRKYCCFSPDGSSFEVPPDHVVRQHRVVVTTVEMSLHLTTMKLKGNFTHIFIDEAAQMLECETVMPLTLATDKTCVVLTGDHIQISPKVYSAEARCQNFGMSMLERLHQYYFEFYHQLQSRPHSTPLNIFLSINYRTKMEILRFISAVFYGGPDKLTASGNIPSVVELTPLLFYAVQGREVQESDSTSFHNHAESSEVVERVMELLDNWPQEWGKVAPEQIGIVTPYHDQVKRIRYILKSRRRADLRQVNVETVQNIQGKEYRALFISTVRTRNLLDSEHVAKALMEAESVGGVADFAFLSDRKLLNTAMTRTKSLVAVVGDPVALCAIGECIQIWRTYLKHCHNMRSIYPDNINYESIKNQVVHLQMSPMGKRLREVAELCQNPNYPPSAPQPSATTTSRSSSNISSANDYRMYEEVFIDDHVPAYGARDSAHASAAAAAAAAAARPVPEVAVPVARVNGHSASSPVPLKPMGSVTKAMAKEDKAKDLAIVPDEILLGLARESLGGGPLTELLKVECVSVLQEGGQAVVSYNDTLANEDKRTRILQAAAAGKEFDGDAEIYVDRDEDSGVVTKYYNYTELTLQAALHNQPERFKRCSVHITGDACVAKVLDPQDPTQEVEVKGSLRRGRAFDKDEVVVEILPVAEEDEEEEKSQKAQGRVVGILQRAIKHCYRSFVCSADSANTGLLMPINPGIPRVYNVVLQKHVQRVKRGFVCVYKLSADKALSFSHYEKVEANATESKLFVVRYLKWLPGFFNPLGVVVGVIPAGHDLASCLNIVDIEHHLPSQFSAQVMEEVQSRYHDGYTLPAEVYEARTNMTETWCFTIDPPHATGLEVAFSIDQLSDTSYQVCVHVSDVAHFVEQGTALDGEALQRGSSILPIGREPVHMLPDKLSSDLCSLRPGVDRCALSIFLTVAGSGEEWRVVETTMQRTIINSKHRFSPQDVEDILNDIQGAENDYLKSCVLVLFQIALMRRKQRKGNAHLDPELSPAEMTAPRGHHMVQELLIMANHEVADQLLKVFPQITPLLQQAMPNVQKLEAWKSKHAADAINSVALTKPFLEGYKVCTCRMVCMCVFSYMRDQEVKPLDHFDVLTELWNRAVEAVPIGATDMIQKVVASPENHPQSSVALEELHSIFPPQQFVCSGSVDPSQQGHYSLNLPCFTSVTSPLHSYISIVVQRLMSALISDQPCPYAQPEMERLVAACNHSRQQADSYASADAMVHLAAALQSRPLTLFPVLERLDGEMLRLRFPNFPCVPESERNVAVTSLCPSALPQVSPDTEQVKLTWQERIYDAAFTNGSQSSTSRRDGVELCGDRFVSHVPPFQWQKLLAAVREENVEKQLTTLPAVQEHVHDSLSDGRFVLDISSEVRRGGLIQHFAEFSLSLHSCMVVQVQLAAELTRGLLMPRLQLFSLSPTLDICVEHRSNPTQCFTKPTATAAAISSTHMDEASYQQCWMPVLALEAAEAAVHSQTSALIHNVSVLWTREPRTGDLGDQLCVVGRFSLSQSFCKERQIILTGDSQSRDNLGVFGLESSMPVPLDLLCMRYRGLEIPVDSELDERVLAMVKMGSSASWVGHCVVEAVERDKRGKINLQVRLQSTTVEMPSLLLDSSVAHQLPCTVEWIPKTLLFRQMEFGVSCLRSASDLARDVAVGRRPVNNIDQSDVPFLADKLGGQLNFDQKEAVQMALKQPFTVIQGPPGSGKTLTAAHLACLFVERNRMTPQSASQDMARTQVLICASSDTAVDAVAVHLKSFSRAAPRMVRVYEEHVENLAFPVPRDTVPPSKVKAASASSPELQGIALHHLIRHPPNRFYQKILEFDSLFGLYPQDITDDQVEEYRSIVGQAQLQELRQAEVILATCSAAASPKLAMGSNVKQIIIDSCESCMEPESLLPVILMRKAQQLVLLGDHCQMQPAVTSPTASSLGLARSLLERYANTAITLKEQYRMHKGIGEVPSACFYNGELKVTTKAQLGPAELDVWPGSQAQPIAFCHVVGREETVTTAMEAGVKPSICNAREADVVASVVEGLVLERGIGESSVVVISQYEAQHHLIQHHLAQRNLASVAINTVHQCQGREFDYVVLSTCRSVSRNEVEKMPMDDWLQRHLGVTANFHQINTALTRAKKGLVIIGNKYLLQSHASWNKLLEHYRQHKAVLDADNFIDALS